MFPKQLAILQTNTNARAHTQTVCRIHAEILSRNVAWY